MNARLILRGARWPGDIAISEGYIETVGDVDIRVGDRIIDLNGDIITPGLVNTHHHLFQWLTRGRAVNSDLFEWLKELYPVWARIGVDDVHVAATRGLAELALSGCTTAFDHHFLVPDGDLTVFDAIVEAAKRVGIRLHLSRGAIDLGQRDGGLPDDSLVEDRDTILASTESLYHRLHDGVFVNLVLGPVGPFSATPELMRDSAVLAEKLGIRLHTHLAETLDEENYCRTRYGARPLDLMEEWGWLTGRAWFAHAIHLNDAELRTLARVGAGVAHCPSSNARVAAGTAQVEKMLHYGIPVGLGVDGPASNEVGALFPEMRQATYAARVLARRADAMSVQTALNLATEGGARCLGRTDIGKLEPGARADIAVWPADDLADVEDTLAGLVLGPDRKVRHLFVGGEAVVWEGQLQSVDLTTVRDEHSSRVRRLWRN